MFEKYIPYVYHAIITDDEIDFLALFHVLKDGWKLVVFAALGTAFIIAAYALTLPPLYLSKISIYTIVSDTPKLSGLAGIATNFGVSIGGDESQLDVADIIASRSLRTKIAEEKWTSTKHSEKVDLLEYWEISSSSGFSLNPLSWIRSLLASKGDWTAASRDRAYLEETIKILNERISVDENINGLVTVNIWMEEPLLAANVANKIFDLVSEKLISVNVAQAKMKREFIEQRSTEVREGLIRREENVALFLSNNVSYQSSPHLILAYNRLNRAVQIESQVYMTLMQEYELAKIEEVKETPNIGVLDKGIPPSKKDRPRRKVMVILAFLLGSGAALTFLYTRNYWLGAKIRTGLQA